MPYSENGSSHSLSIDQLNQQMRVVINGTLVGVAGRWMTWPLEYAMYRSSEKTNTKSLFKIYSELFNLKTIYQLNYSFLTTGFTQTVGKAVTNIGVLYYVDFYYPHLSPTSKGFFAACLSAPSETIVSSRGEYRKVQAFYQQYQTVQLNSLFPQGFSRVVTANLMRNFPTSVVTFSGIYKTTEILTPMVPSSMSDNPLIKGVFACLANIIIQPINMPFINFQTYVLRNPCKPIFNLMKSFYEEHTFSELFKGTTARIIHRGVFYGLTFMATTYLKSKQLAKESESLKNQSSCYNIERPKNS